VDVLGECSGREQPTGPPGGLDSVRIARPFAEATQHVSPAGRGRLAVSAEAGAPVSAGSPGSDDAGIRAARNHVGGAKAPESTAS